MNVWIIFKLAGSITRKRKKKRKIRKWKNNERMLSACWPVRVVLRHTLCCLMCLDLQLPLDNSDARQTLWRGDNPRTFCRGGMEPSGDYAQANNRRCRFPTQQSLNLDSSCFIPEINCPIKTVARRRGIAPTSSSPPTPCSRSTPTESECQPENTTPRMEHTQQSVNKPKHYHRDINKHTIHSFTP